MDRRSSYEDIHSPDEYELDQIGDQDGHDQEETLLPSGAVDSYPRMSAAWSLIIFLASCLLLFLHKLPLPNIVKRGSQTHRSRLLQLLLLLLIPPSTAPLFFGLFLPSHYTGLPATYPFRGWTENEGSANPNNENIFIAANIIDEGLIRGRWGESVQELIYLLGRRNVFLSIYENDSGAGTAAALDDLRGKITCDASIVTTSLPLSLIPTIQPSFIGHPVTKRITYLATVRNLALLPLTSTTNDPTPAELTSTTTTGYQPVPLPPTAYSKILFLNDVIFSAADAAHLLFDTHSGTYAAACALDFIDPVKFYDTFATRNTHGDGIGLPLYPFFTPGPSQRALLSGTDAVPVKSCWGGMVAFNATSFTRREQPVRFRSDQDEEGRESSECCLVHADIDDAAHTFVNPYIRVAYGPTTFLWMRLAKRVERIWYLPQKFLSWVVGMPWRNERRDEVAGQVFTEVDRTGQEVRRVATKGGFCGIRGLFLVEDVGGRRKTSKYSVPDR
ncbi:hypothetical protein MMC19_006124 [Ptychographa xylographoides]|nr:hypothetical protein [Ptychographa xylographoides]